MLKVVEEFKKKTMIGRNNLNLNTDLPIHRRILLLLFMS